eukprot:9829911-Alexandrium_andersonii.AAC.1
MGQNKLAAAVVQLAPAFGRTLNQLVLRSLSGDSGTSGTRTQALSTHCCTSPGPRPLPLSGPVVAESCQSPPRNRMSRR